MFARRKRNDLRGTWPGALVSLSLSLLLILTIRWAFFEPYIIPSGSMVPTLHVHDHILVNKFSYGVRAPFSQKWIVKFSEPKRGDVVVFRSVEDPQIFLVKRVIGLPGDELEITNRSIKINGELVPQPLATDEQKAPFALRKHQEERLDHEHEFRVEKLGDREHMILYWKPATPTDHSRTIKVPEEHLFMMGDNRDHSGDSRVWGTLPRENVLGKATHIWLSCEKMAEGSSRLCDFSTLRSERIFSRVQ